MKKYIPSSEMGWSRKDLKREKLTRYGRNTVSLRWSTSKTFNFRFVLACSNWSFKINIFICILVSALWTEYYYNRKLTIVIIFMWAAICKQNDNYSYLFLVVLHENLLTRRQLRLFSKFWSYVTVDWFWNL